MPKIPTFQTEGRITAEVGGVKSNVQVPLSQTLGTALAPATQAIVQHRVQEKNFENKTEALKLENEALLQFTDTLDRASRLDNKDQAFELIKTESERIKNNFSNKASNKYVQTMFNNNFYGEVQKGIFKVNSAVSTNILQSLDNQVSIKRSRLLTDGIFGQNPLSQKLLIDELVKLYEDNYKGRIDKNDYDRIINNVPNEIETFKVIEDINKNPIQTFLDLKDNKKYTNLNFESRTDFLNKAKQISQSLASKNLKEYLESAKEGKQSIYSKESLILPFEGTVEYADILEKIEIADIVRTNSNQIKDSNYGEESNVIENILIEGTQIKYKKDAQSILQSVANEKAKKIQTDSAGYYSEINNNLIDINEKISFAIESNNIEQEAALIQERNSLLDNVYNEKGIPNSIRKYISQAESKNLVSQFKSIENPKDQIGFLEILNKKYGEKIVDIYSQLEGDGLPSGALIMVSTNSVDLKNDIAKGFDVKTLEENIVNSTALKKTDLNDIKFSINSELEDGYNKIINSQPIGSISQAAHINKVTDGLYQAVLYKMFNENLNKEDAAKKVVKEFNKDYLFQETFWIPNDINGDDVNQKDILAKSDFILDAIKETNYLDKIDLSHYGSTDENMTIEDNIKVMKKDIKDNAVWYLNPKGDGLWLYVIRTNGNPLIVSDKNGKKIELKFLDTSTKLPITNEEYEYTDLDFTPETRKGRG
jgi:hypothetical protein